jgi:hypothetical protein
MGTGGALAWTSNQRPQVQKAKDRRPKRLAVSSVRKAPYRSCPAIANELRKLHAQQPFAATIRGNRLPPTASETTYPS